MLSNDLTDDKKNKLDDDQTSSSGFSSGQSLSGEDTERNYNEIEIKHNDVDTSSDKISQKPKHDFEQFDLFQSKHIVQVKKNQLFFSPFAKNAESLSNHSPRESI